MRLSGDSICHVRTGGADNLFIYLLNFAIIMHSWQGHHNSMVPITVGPLNR